VDTGDVNGTIYGRAVRYSRDRSVKDQPNCPGDINYQLIIAASAKRSLGLKL